MDFMDEKHDPQGLNGIEAFIEWRLKTASGLLASKRKPHVVDLLAPEEEGEWDTEGFW